MSRPKYRVITSKKPNRQGEAFIARGDCFLMKLYRDGFPDVIATANRLVKKLQEAEDRKYRVTLPEGQTAYAGVYCNGDGGRTDCGGLVDITSDQYDAQMAKPDHGWVCPRCGGSAQFDDERFEELNP